MASSYDAGVFPVMDDFLRHLKSKNYNSRKVGIVQNGSWAPTAGRVMKGLLEEMKNITLCDTLVTIKTTLNEESTKALEALADEMV
jgi:flavorubredoxin